MAGQKSNKSLGNPQCSNTHKPEGKRTLNYVKLSHKKHTIKTRAHAKDSLPQKDINIAKNTVVELSNRYVTFA